MRIIDHHVPVVQQRRPVDVRFVHHAELDQPRTPVAVHGPALVGIVVQDIAATGGFLQVPFGNIVVADLAKVVQLNIMYAGCDFVNYCCTQSYTHEQK